MCVVPAPLTSLSSASALPPGGRRDDCMLGSGRCRSRPSSGPRAAASAAGPAAGSDRERNHLSGSRVQICGSNVCGVDRSHLLLTQNHDGSVQGSSKWFVGSFQLDQLLLQDLGVSELMEAQRNKHMLIHVYKYIFTVSTVCPPPLHLQLLQPPVGPPEPSHPKETTQE